MQTGEFAELAHGLYIEGLCVDYARDVIWYSDVIAGGIHGIRPDGAKVTSFNEDRMWTGGVMMNADGSVLSTGQYGIMWNNPDSGKSGWLLREIDGKPISGINEVMPDGTGGIFFGTIDMDNVIAGQPTAPASVYRLATDGTVTRLWEDVGFANGVMYDAARRRFYCNNTFCCTWAFDVGDDLSLSNKTMFLEKEDADGMALDAQGNLWITGFRSSFITRMSPDGVRLADVTTPAGAITQVRFGGADMRDYYVASVPADGGDTLKEGGQITEVKSVLYRGRSDVPGMRIEPARFTLG